MNKASLETAIRNDILDAICNFLSETRNTDVMAVSASELVLPVVDAEGNEKFALVKVSIPRGQRSENGYIPYDGYAEAEAYKEELDEKNAKKALREAKQKKKENKKTVTNQKNITVQE